MLKFGVFLVLLLIIDDLSAHKRKLSTAINPGCKEPLCQAKNESSPFLVHIRAEGDEDTLHHIWDLTGSPSLLLVRTDKDAELNITWDRYLKGNGTKSISFSRQPSYIMTIVVDKIFEFNDVDDKGIFDKSKSNNSSYVRTVLTSSFRWSLIQPMTNDTSTALLSVEGVPRKHSGGARLGRRALTSADIGKLEEASGGRNATGSIRISMGAYGGVEHGNERPHMLHSSNTSQMDIILDRMPSTFAHSRYGVGLLIATSDPSNSTLKIDKKSNNDDEYAPGVFKTVEVTSPGAREKYSGGDGIGNRTTPGGGAEDGGYMQWRPIIYTSPAREDTDSTDTMEYGIDTVALADISTRLNDSLPFKVFGKLLGADYLLQSTDVTFGAPSDGFYKKTNFATWTFVAGVGKPASEGLSNVVLLILAIGLGVPLVTIGLGVLCVIVRRVMRNKDDLFLSQ